MGNIEMKKYQLNRRQFSYALAGSMSLMSSARAANAKKKIAFLGTEVYQHSHAQHFLDRFSIGFSMGGRWHEPEVEIAAVYIDQHSDRDLAEKRIAKYGLKSAPSIAEALTLGTSNLAVDGVVVIGEHGSYPKTDRGQTRYPRYEWFQEIVKIFEHSGRSVPVFNDKHLSTSWGECREMVRDAKRLEFPFYAGSSLPVTWRLPALELPYDTALKESVCVAYGGVDSYDFHALETAQCMSERRVGGEVGIRSVLAAKDDHLWQELLRRDVTSQLFVSALSRSHSLPVETGYPTDRVTIDWAREALTSITGYFIEHLDGFRTTIFLTNISDFNYAGMLSDGEIIGCQMMLPMPGRNATTADFFNPLSAHVESMIVHGKTNYPIERTLLTSGMVIGGVESLYLGEKPFLTDDMAVPYHAPRESMFWSI